MVWACKGKIHVEESYKGVKARARWQHVGINAGWDMCSQHYQASGFEIWVQDCMRDWELKDSGAGIKMYALKHGRTSEPYRQD